MPFIITRDDRPTFGRFETDADVMREMHRRVGYSMDHATTHEGYGVLEVPADRWSDLEAGELRAVARRVISDHGHAGYWDDDTRASCGACALAGFGADQDGEPGPNYAGWARLYVEAGRSIPGRWLDAFVAELHCDNDSYVSALRLSLATFGVRFGAES